MQIEIPKDWFLARATQEELSEIATPRVDAAQVPNDSMRDMVVSAGMARQLERELYEAEAQLITAKLVITQQAKKLKP